MGLKRVMSMGERLQSLLDNAEKEAEEIVANAERKADEMISEAKAEAIRKRNLARRGSGIDELLREAEAKAKIEAEKSLEAYKERVEALKKIPKKKIQDAVAFVLKEVLPE
jgi:regulator of protease activity HflC (stomatin/prohibitin superfamily)